MLTKKTCHWRITTVRNSETDFSILVQFTFKDKLYPPKRKVLFLKRSVYDLTVYISIFNKTAHWVTSMFKSFLFNERLKTFITLTRITTEREFSYCSLCVNLFRGFQYCIPDITILVSVWLVTITSCVNWLGKPWLVQPLTDSTSVIPFLSSFWTEKCALSLTYNHLWKHK